MSDDEARAKVIAFGDHFLAMEPSEAWDREMRRLLAEIEKASIELGKAVAKKRSAALEKLADDETAYLLRSPANAARLLRSISE